MGDLTKSGGDSLDNNYFNFSQEEVGLIKSQVCKPKNREATDTELKYFISVSQQAGLNPFHKQIYAVFRNNKNQQTGKWDEVMSIQTGIDGLRLVANRTGLFAGCEEAQYEYRDTDKRQTTPMRCVFTVYKIVQGHRCPFTADASWDEFYPGDTAKGSMWRKMPRVMLSKVAESRALRMAFPMELSGLYVKEEMHKAESDSEIESAVIDKTQHQDYGRQKELMDGIAAELSELTSNLSLEEKGKFMVKMCKVQSFSDLKNKSIPELEGILVNLKSQTIEVENES